MILFLKLGFRGLIFALCIFVAVGCQSKTESDQPETAPQTAESRPPEGDKPQALSDDDVLMLIERLPLGVPYRQVKAVFPEIGQLNFEGGSEGMGRLGLYDARVDLNLLGLQASIEFNFRHDSLYSYYGRIMDLDTTTCSRLYRELQEFYLARMGEYVEEHKADEYLTGHTSFWPGDEYDFAVSNNTFHDRGSILGWGVQESGTLRPKQTTP